MNKTRKEKLDQFAINIEFLLISVVQGVALGALATNASEPIASMQFEYWLYVGSGFLFILNFWSQAIIHTLSFIDWPLDMPHNFLYFLVSLIEVMAFSHITSPLLWFAFISAFFVAAIALYLFDLSLIRKHQEKFNATQAQKQLYGHMFKRETFELSVFLPAALIFNLIALAALKLFPRVFLTNHNHLILIGLQVLFGLIFLIDSMRNFNKRSQLIANVAD